MTTLSKKIEILKKYHIIKHGIIGKKTAKRECMYCKSNKCFSWSRKDGTKEVTCFNCANVIRRLEKIESNVNELIATSLLEISKKHH